MDIRRFETSPEGHPPTPDETALQTAIDADKFHPGEWKVEHFKQPTALVQVIEDTQGAIAFVRYTKTLRISCVWADADSRNRNGRAAVLGIKDAVDKAKNSGFTEVIITTNHPPLARFFTTVLKMKHRGDEYLLEL